MLLHVILLLVVCTYSIMAIRPFAVHFDIEPAFLPEWTSDPQTITNEYLDLLQSISTMKGSQLDLVVDTSISFNFMNVTRNGKTKLFYQWVLDYVDIVTMMCYRDFLDGPNGLIALSQPSVDYATQIGKKVIIGVETNNEDPAYVSFYGTNTTYLEYVLSQVNLTFKTKSGFLGVAVHDYAGYQTLSNTKSSGACTSKGLFEWQYTVASDESMRDAYFLFARSRCITTTFLESEYLITKDNHSLAEFWNISQSYGMKLQFLFGDPKWAYTSNHAYVISLVQSTKIFVEGNQ